MFSSVVLMNSGMNMNEKTINVKIAAKVWTVRANSDIKSPDRVCLAQATLGNTIPH